MLLTVSFYCLRVCAKPVDDIQHTSDFKLLVAFHFQEKKKPIFLSLRGLHQNHWYIYLDTFYSFQNILVIAHTFASLSCNLYHLIYHGVY